MTPESAPPAKQPRQLTWQWLLLIFGVALIVRFVFSGMPIIIEADTISYQICAMALVHGAWPGFELVNSPEYGVFIAPALLTGGMSDFLVERTPGFPLVLIALIGWIRMIFGTVTTALLYQHVVIFNSLLGCLSAVLGAVITHQLFKHRWLSLMTGLLVSVSPNMLWMEHIVLTESLFAFCLLVYCYLWLTWREGKRNTSSLMVMGLLSAWILWVKPVGGVIIPVTLLLLFWMHAPKRQMALYLLLPVTAILVWGGFQFRYHQMPAYTAGGGMNQLYKVVDYVVMDSPLHAGFKQELKQATLRVPPYMNEKAVNVVHTSHLVAEAKKPAGQRREMWEIYRQDDTKARAVAWEAIQTYPLRYLGVTIAQFWRNLIEPSDWDPILLFWTPLGLMTLLGSILLWQRPIYRLSARFIVLLFWGHLLFYPWVTMGQFRYRLPLEPLAVILAVYGLFRLMEAIRQRFASDTVQ